MSEQQQPKENIADEIFSMELTGDEIVHLLKAVGTATSLWAKNRRRCPASISMDTLQSACNKVAHSTDPRPHPAPQAPESHCDKCDHWDICEGCPYTDERPIKKDSEYNKRVAAYISPADIDEIKAEAARKAREDEREKVLDKIEEWRCTQDLTKGVLAFEIALGKKIESLRQQQGDQVQPR